MQVFAGCALPEEYLYDLELDSWVRVEDDGSVRLGMTDVAQTLCGKLVSLTFQKRPGASVKRGRTLAVIESAKWVGPFRSPLSGEVLEVNEDGFAADRLLVNRDPYGAGWLVRLMPSALDSERGALVDGLAAFPVVCERIERDQIHCFRCAD
ncbi:MAG: glycine cleavage system protein H [Solirubrobacteraceae bacterium]